MLTSKQIRNVERRKRTYEPNGSAPCPGGETPDGRSTSLPEREEENPLLRRILDHERFPRDSNGNVPGKGGTGEDDSW